MKSDAQALYQLGRDASARGDAQKAVEYFEKAVALKPNSADYHHQLGNAYGQAGAAAGMFGAMPMAKKARAEWERAVQLDPNFMPARFALIDFHLQAPAVLGGSTSAAIEQATELRKRDLVDGHRAFARVHTAAKKPDLVRKEYEDLLKELPASARARYFVGVYQMLTEKNYTSAGAEFESVVKLDPAYMPGYFQIGHVAALASTNFTRGEEALKKYFSYTPKDEEPSIARAHFWLGSIYEKQGKKAEAKASYEASLKINPTQKDAAEAMKRVTTPA